MSGNVPKTKREKKEVAAEAVKCLREQLKPDTVLYFVLVYCSSQGYSTHGYRIFGKSDDTDSGIRDWTWLIGRATGTYRYASEDIRVTGCGFNKPQHITDDLRATLGGDYDAKGRDEKTHRLRGLSYTY